MMDAFRNFVKTACDRRSWRKEFKDRAANPNDTIKKSKLALENFMIENDLETAKISLEGFTTPVTYLSRSNKVQSRRINRETMEEGLEYSFSSEEIPTDESPPEPREAHLGQHQPGEKSGQNGHAHQRQARVEAQDVGRGEDAPYQYDATREMGKVAKDYWTAQR